MSNLYSFAFARKKLVLTRISSWLSSLMLLAFVTVSLNRNDHLNKNFGQKILHIVLYESKVIYHFQVVLQNLNFLLWETMVRARICKHFLAQ